MASLRISCPDCDSTFKLASSEKLGKKVKCAKCGSIFVAKLFPEEEGGFGSDFDEPIAPPAKLPHKKSTSKVHGNGSTAKTRRQPLSQKPPVVALIAGACLLVLVAGTIVTAMYFRGSSSREVTPVVAAPEPASPQGDASTETSISAEMLPSKETVAQTADNEKATVEKFLPGMGWFDRDIDLLIHVNSEEINKSPMVVSLGSKFGVSPDLPFGKSSLTQKDIKSITIGLKMISAAIEKAAPLPEDSMEVLLPRIAQAIGSSTEEWTKSTLGVLHLNRPVSYDDLRPIDGKGEIRRHADRDYLYYEPNGDRSDARAFYLSQPDVLLAGSVETIQRAIAEGESIKPHPMWATLDRDAHLLVAVIDPSKASSIPGQVESTSPMTQGKWPYDLSAAQFSVKVGEDLSIGFQLLSKSTDELPKLKTLIDNQIKYIQTFFRPNISNFTEDLDTISKHLIENLKTEQNPGSLRLMTSIPATDEERLVQLPSSFMLLMAMGGPKNFAPGMKLRETRESNFFTQGAPFQPAVEAQGLEPGITLNASAMRCIYRIDDGDTGKQYVPHGVVFRAKGERFNRLSGMGKIKIHSIKVDQGQVVIDSTDKVNGETLNICKILRHSGQVEPDENNLALLLTNQRFQASRIVSMEGEITCLIGGKRMVHEIPGLFDSKLSNDASPLIKKLGLRKEIKPDMNDYEDYPDYLFSADSVQYVKEMKVRYFELEGKVRTPHEITTSNRFENGRWWHVFAGLKSLPIHGDEVLLVEVIDQPEEQVVSFKFENLPFPKE